MVSRFTIVVLVGIALCAWFLTLYIFGLPIPPYWHKPASIMITVLSTVLLVFERWAWSWPIVRTMAHRPDLRGTWKVEIKSLWTNPETGTSLSPIKGYFCISQTFSKLYIRQFTEESPSETVTAIIRDNDNETLTVFGIYHNDPKPSIQHRSAPHYGSFKLDFIEDHIPRLKGKYWTERATKGELDAEFLSRKKGGDFQSAKRIEAASRKKPWHTRLFSFVSNK